MSARRRRSLLSPGPKPSGSPGSKEPAAPRETPDDIDAGEDTPTLGFSDPPPEAAAPLWDASPPEGLTAPEPLEDAPTEVIEDSETEVVVVGGGPADADEALQEDADPLIGHEIDVPPGDFADEHLPSPTEVTSHLRALSPPEHDPSPPPELGPLVIFDDEADSVVDPEPHVYADDADAGWADEEAPPGFAPEVAHALRGHTPEPARARSAPPSPGRRAAPLEEEVESSFFSEGEDPPTEEHGGHLPEDLANLYRAPMNVPEPPPLPGILDRFTPSPTRRGSARPADRRGEGPAPVPEVNPPKGLWDETPMPADHRPMGGTDETPPPVPWRSDPREDAAPPIWKDPMIIAAGVVAALLALVIVLGAAFLLPGFLSPEPELTQPASIAPVMPRQLPPPAALIPEDPVVPLPDSVLPTPPDQVAPLPVGTDPKPPATNVQKPRPKPAEPVAPRDETPAARKGTLRIRAAKNVLISIDGQPVGMTPIDVDKPAGKYVLSATIDGQRREERVDLTSGTIRLVEF